MLDVGNNSWIPTKQLEKSFCAVVDVPFYFWEEAHGLLPMKGVQTNFKYDVHIRGMDIGFTRMDQQGGFPLFDQHQVQLRYFRKGERTPQNKVIQVKPNYGNINYTDLSDTQLRGVSYIIYTTMSDVQDFHSEFFGTETWELPRFKQLYDLGYVRPNIASVRDRFFFGLSHEQWSCVYSGRKLNGKCYAFLCGTYAILLDDELHLDSIVSLRGVEDGLLTIDRVMYTESPYMTKVVAMTRYKPTYCY